MQLKRTLLPTSSPISLADAKRHLGVTDDLHDRDILALVQAAANTLRRWTGRELLATTYELTFRRFPAGVSEGFELPFPPLVSITSIQYYDAAGVLQTYSGAQIELSEVVPAILWPARNTSWPDVQSDRTDAVKITYVAGYASPEVLPAEVGQFIRLLIRHWYDNPSAVTTGSTKEVELSLRLIANSLGTGFYADV